MNHFEQQTISDNSENSNRKQNERLYEDLVGWKHFPDKARKIVAREIELEEIKKLFTKNFRILNKAQRKVLIS